MPRYFDTIEERLERLEYDYGKLKSKAASQENAIFELQRKVYFLKQREMQRKIDDYLEHYNPRGTQTNKNITQ